MGEGEWWSYAFSCAGFKWCLFSEIFLAVFLRNQSSYQVPDFIRGKAETFLFLTHWQKNKPKPINQQTKTSKCSFDYFSQIYKRLKFKYGYISYKLISKNLKVYTYQKYNGILGNWSSSKSWLIKKPTNIPFFPVPYRCGVFLKLPPLPQLQPHIEFNHWNDQNFFKSLAIFSTLADSLSTPALTLKRIFTH